LASTSALNPKYSSDEVALGVAVAVALHLVPLIVLVVRATHPMPQESADQALVSKPVIAASLLKLGKPIDPSQLPDRVVPRKSTAPKQDIAPSPNDPARKNPADAGPPPPNVDDSDLTRLLAKSDPFAEDGGKARPEQGFAEGVEGGLETDPSKVHAGDLYGARLGGFFHERWQYPTVISQGEANRLCVVFQFNVSPRMVIWHLRLDPVKPSGNELFDDSARTMLQKLMDDRAALPDPPAEVADVFKGRTVQVALSGDLHGDTSRCK
jgi:hypothetical protein